LSSTAGDERLGTGAVVCLSGLGLAAAATILAFFGTGFFLLREYPAAIARLGLPPGIGEQGSLPTLTRGSTASPSLQSRQREATASADQPAQTRAPGARKREASAVASNHTTPSSTAAVTSPGARPEPAITPPARQSTTAVPPLPARVPEALSPTPNPLRPAEANLSGPTQARSVAAPEPGANAPLSAAEIKALLIQGDAAFHRGDLTAARLLYRRAFEAGDGHGALGLGASYDPLFLRRFDLWTQPSNPDVARSWYLRARDLGVSEAEGRLDRLNGKPVP
jgi:hypothetical protein